MKYLYIAIAILFTGMVNAQSFNLGCEYIIPDDCDTTYLTEQVLFRGSDGEVRINTLNVYNSFRIAYKGKLYNHGTPENNSAVICGYASRKVTLDKVITDLGSAECSSIPVHYASEAVLRCAGLLLNED